MFSTPTRWALLGILVASLFAAYWTYSTERRRPNFVLIVTDDQHPAAIEHMPNTLQELAAHGVRFENAFATTPICAPSRVSILTGQYPTTHGVFDNGIRNADGDMTGGAFAFDGNSSLATWMQDAGYKTALLGKYLNQYQFITPEVPPGWDDWRVFAEDIEVFFDYHLNENGHHVKYGNQEQEYSTDVLARHAVDFIQRHSDQPFLLVFSPFAPHSPSEPAPRHRGSLQSLPEWRPPSWNEKIGFGKPGWIRLGTANFKEAGVAARTRKRIEQIESLLAVDDALETILTALEDNGIGDDTVVIFTTDHGIGWGEHRWTGKQLAYEESIRVPLVVRYPARWPEPGALAELALNVDIAPTILQLAGASPDVELDGRSLVDLLDGREQQWREHVVLRHFRGGFLVPPWDTIRDARHKLIRTGRFVELYDLEQDPFELTNLAKDSSYKELRHRLTTQLDAHLDRHPVRRARE